MGAPTPATEANFAAIALEVSDVTGAGDTVIGTLALALAAKASLVEAAQLSTIAAGIAVSRFGPVAVTRDELMARLTTIAQFQKFRISSDHQDASAARSVVRLF